jgi:cell division protein FtsA
MLGLELNEYLLHEYPQRYAIDRQNTTLMPLGLHGRKFEMDLLLICADIGYLQNITKAVEQIGIDAMQMVFSGIAASDAVLTSEEKEKGVILVDIGDTLTNVLIFKDGVPRCVHGLSFGGRNLTEIISNYFKISPELADGIKESSMEIDSELAETDEVMIKTEEVYRPIKKKELLSITGPELDKFIATLRSVIFNCGLDNVSGMPVVATGGLSLLEGLLEKMERDLGLSVKLGLVKNLQDVPASQGPAVAAALGLLCRQRDQYRKTDLLTANGKNKVTKIVDYFVNLYQDYF